MSTQGPDPRRGDPLRVRFSWPGEEPAHEDAAASEPWPSSSRPGEWDVANGETNHPNHPVPVVEADTIGAASLRRVLVDAYDRLADRVLQRIRDVREDLDADLTELRSELVTLRQSVDDVGDRVQLRQLRAALDELRNDVAGLRRAVLEDPEHERTAPELSAIRADIADLVGRVRREASPPPLPSLAPLVQELGALRALVEAQQARLARIADAAVAPDDSPVADELAALRSVLEAQQEQLVMLAETGRVSDDSSVADELAALRSVFEVQQEQLVMLADTGRVSDDSPVADELAAIREELASLRRRIALRAAAPSTDAISDAAVERIAEIVADVVVERLTMRIEASRRR